MIDFLRCPVHQILYRGAPGVCPCCQLDAKSRGLNPSIRLRGEHYELPERERELPPSVTKYLAAPLTTALDPS